MSRARFLVLLLCLTVASPQSERILNYAVVGSASCKGGPCWSVIDRIEVQRALLEAAKEPRTAADLTGILGRSGATLSDLEALRLVQRQNTRYRIAFTLFPADDVRRTRTLAEVHARSLADSLLSRRAEIQMALHAYAVPGVDPKDVAFIVLGCFSLDWDGLAISKAKGYRTDKGAARPDGHYVPWAEERIEEPYRSFSYSTSNSQDDFGVVSFSDGSAHDQFLLRAWRDETRAVVLGRILLAMRGGNATLASLAQAANMPPSAAEPLLAQLTERQYIHLSGERYTVGFPVLSRQDKQMVDRLRKIGRDAITSWLAANYAKLEADLSGIAPVRAGVPYREAFNQIWHDVFGRANAMLVEAGLFADPYVESRIWRHYTPAVYSRTLTR